MGAEVPGAQVPPPGAVKDGAWQASQPDELWQHHPGCT